MKNQSLEFVKKVPDFIQKLGMTNTDVKGFKERNEHKLEDKFSKKEKTDEKE